MVDLGGLGDKAKDFASQHQDQVDQGVDKAGDAVNQRTDDKYEDQVTKGEDAVRDHLDDGDDSGNRGEHR